MKLRKKKKKKNMTQKEGACGQTGQKRKKKNTEEFQGKSKQWQETCDALVRG